MIDSSHESWLIFQTRPKTLPLINLQHFHLVSRSQIRTCTRIDVCENGLPNLPTFHRSRKCPWFISATSIKATAALHLNEKRSFSQNCGVRVCDLTRSNFTSRWSLDGVSGESRTNPRTIWRPTTTSSSTPSICQSASCEGCVCVSDCVIPGNEALHKLGNAPDLKLNLKKWLKYTINKIKPNTNIWNVSVKKCKKIKKIFFYKKNANTAH